jgi:sarcosine oxidase subunit alpha
MRLDQGGSRIDRSRTVHFRFDDREYEGFAGDTIASALLANNVRIVGRGIYTGRPRGVFTAGSEEPNALVEVRWPNGTSEPSLRATVVEIADGLEAWSLVGRGRLAGEDRGRFDRKYVHVETLVIGGGDAGRAAAARGDGRVLLVDEGPVAEPIVGVDVLTRATALGIYDHGFVLIAERRPGHRTEGRLWHVRTRRIVLATGALERPIPFPQNDRPGVMLASAAAAYVERYGVLPARRFSLATTNDSGTESAAMLLTAGAVMEDVFDLRQGDRVDGRRASLLLVAGGWNPNLALWSQARGGLRFDDRIGAYVPDGTLKSVEVVGSATGEGLPDCPAPTWEGVGDERFTFVDLERDSTVADIRRHWEPASGRSSTSSATRRSGRAATRARPAASWPARSRPHSSARSRARSACPPTGRRTCPCRSRSSPGGIGANSTTRFGRRRSRRGTSSTARCSRTSGSGNGRATSRGTGRRWTTPCCASARRLAVPWR